MSSKETIAQTINAETEQQYVDYWKSKDYRIIYPSEFVVRTFLGSSYPNLRMPKPKKHHAILDASCGYGRNLLFFLQQGYEAYGCDISEDICDLAIKNIKFNLEKTDLCQITPQVLVGKNNALPFEDAKFDYVLAQGNMLYLSEGTNMLDNVKEYSRVIKSGGWLVACLIANDAAYFKESKLLNDGTYLLQDSKNSMRCWAPSSIKEIEAMFSSCFDEFCFAEEKINYWGNELHNFWVACQKK
jgi:SAM-dependent methyltransferase